MKNEGMHQGCTSSASLNVTGTREEAIGYFKPSNTNQLLEFGRSVTLSASGDTLVVGASSEDSGANGEDSGATSTNGNQSDDSAMASGAVYIFVRDDDGEWFQQAYVKASNTGAGDRFGTAIGLSADGNTLAVSATGEDSGATGTNGDQSDDSVEDSGAAYVFTRDGMGAWSQQAYIKASNTGIEDRFSGSLDLSGNGKTLAIGASEESSSAIGVNGDQGDDATTSSGAVYLFVCNEVGAWSQQSYIKPSNTDFFDNFGASVGLSDDGDTLAVGANGERSDAIGIDGDQDNNDAIASGAVYMFTREGVDTWSQQAYVKASNTDPLDSFGAEVALDREGDTLVVSASGETSDAVGIGGNQASETLDAYGAVYVFSRDRSGSWSPRAYVKAPNSGEDDRFGGSLALSADGHSMAVGAHREQSDVCPRPSPSADPDRASRLSAEVCSPPVDDRSSSRPLPELMRQKGGPRVRQLGGRGLDQVPTWVASL